MGGTKQQQVGAAVVLGGLVAILGLAFVAGGEDTPPTAPRAPRIARERSTREGSTTPPTPAAAVTPAPARAQAATPKSARFALDAAGNPLRVSTPAGRAWSFTWEREQLVGSAGVGGPVTWSRDGQGRVAGWSDPSGRRVELARDAQGRLTTFAAQGALEEGFRYDHAGRLIAAFAGEERLTWAHDGNEHVTCDDQQAGVRLTYDMTPGRAEVRSPFGSTTFTHDVRGRVSRLDTPAGAFGWTRDAQGRVASRTGPGGVTATWSAGGQRDGTTIAGDAGRVLSVERLHRGDVIEVTRDGRAEQFTHDAQGRLASREVGGHETRWSYDQDGNRTGIEQDGRATEIAHDRDGRIARHGERTVTHDAAGRLTAFGADRFEYDAFGRLAAVTRAGSARVAYAYDGLGRVATRTVGDASTRYVYDGPRLLAEVGPGARRRTWVFGPTLDEPLAYRDRAPDGTEGSWTYLHADALGSVLAYTDASGATIATASFDPWGNVETGPGADRPVIFAGRLVDQDARLIHLRARFYDPALGRFLTPDPAGLLGGLNAYAYVHQDPLRQIDPLGLWGETPEALQGRRELLERTSPLTADLADAASEEAARADLPGRVITPFRAPIDQSVSEVQRAHTASGRKLLFLKGEVAGLGKAVVGTVRELGNFGVDLLSIAGGGAWDAAFEGEETPSLLAHLEYRSGLSRVFAEGRALDTFAEMFSGLPERIAEGSRRTAILYEEGRVEEAGEVFGETVLFETVGLLELGVGLKRFGVNLSTMSAAQRRATIREAVSLGYRPGAGDAILARIAARVRDGAAAPAAPIRPVAPVIATSAPAVKLPEAPATGLAQALDSSAPRGVTPVRPTTWEEFLPEARARFEQATGRAPTNADAPRRPLPEINGMARDAVPSPRAGSPGTTGAPAVPGDPYSPEAVAARVQRPPYRANAAHDPRSPSFNPRKTPEPVDAAPVYETATRAAGGTWFGKGQGGWYRYFYDNAGGVHFSGIVSENTVPVEIVRGAR